MAQVPLEIRVTVDSAAVRKALRGIQNEAVAVEKATQKEISKTDKARKKSLDEAKGGMQQLARGFERLGAGIERELKSNIFKGVKDGIRNAANYLKANKGAIAIGAITGGVVAGRRGFDRARQITGAPSIMENIASAKQFEMRLAELQNIGPNLDIQAIKKRIQAQASQGILSPLELLSGVEAVQRLEGQDAVPRFLESMQDLANFSEGLGANFEGLSKLSTILERQFGILPEQMAEAVGMIAEAGALGSVELENFSSEFPKVMGLFSQVVGRGGMSGAKEFAAISQAIATAYPDAPAEAATATKSLIKALGDTETRKILSARGLDPRTTTIPDIAKALAANPLSDKQFQKAFGRVEAQIALGALINQYTGPTGSNVLTKVLNTNGQGQIDRALSNTQNVRGTALGQDMMRANEMQSRMIDNFRDTADAALRLTRAIDRLTSEFPGAIMIGQAIAEFAATIGVLAKLNSIAKGTKETADAIRTAAEVGGATTVGTTTAASAGGAMIAATVGGLAVSTGAAALSAYGYNQIAPMQGVRSMPTAGNPFGMPTLYFDKSAKNLEDAADSLKRSAYVLETKTASQQTPVGREEGD